MTSRPAFWIVLALLGSAGFLTAIRLFPAAFPIITLDLEMDREAAVAQAQVLARSYGWAPAEARTAATFGQLDPEVQTYVELEAGGRDAFVALADNGIYHPYVWTVRRFSEGAVEESRVRFTPAGEPYGFLLQLSEADPGSGNLPEAEARAVAERTASEWGVDLAFFEFLESSAETQPGGRLDHTLVFERTDTAVNDGRFRLRMRIAGNRASELTHFVYVPQAFSQRYLDMRSTNEAIALVSQSVFILVFLLLGGVVGTALLMRKRWVVWRPPLLWGTVAAVLLGLGMVNALPLSWMDYDPAVSVRTFLAGQLALAGATMAMGAPLLAFLFLAGESLGRRAFPDHLQQWRFWSPEVAGSTAALGRTVAAYLLLGIQLGYVVLFYLAASRLEGWWSPAEAVVQPDLLAMPQPWLQAVSISLFAALWEESAFRAIPIACAALVGARYGRKGLWIWGAVAIQAVVFAAGHANYPQQPAYARVAELMFPAFLWGVIYLYFGLIPTILTHFTYNLSLISLPLFASEAPGVVFDRVVVVAVGLLPLLVATGARLRRAGRAEAPDWAYNRAWKPPVVEAAEAEVGRDLTESLTPGVPLAPSGDTPVKRAARPLPGTLGYAMGAVGAFVWATGTLLCAGDSPRLASSRNEAVAAALDTLEQRGHAARSWRALASVPLSRRDDHQYVFDEAGEEVYADLSGSYLPGPGWVVRFVDFAADPEQRVEELRVHFEPGGEFRRLEHIVPEARPGARLEEEGARAAALSVLRERFGIDTESLREVGAAQTTRPARTDWEFTFEDPTVLPDIPGNAQLTVELAGADLADVNRSVTVPEEWERGRRDSEALQGLVAMGAGLVLLLGFGAAAVLGVLAWAKHRLDASALLRAGFLALGVLALGQANSWPAAAAEFSATQPWGLQVGITVFAGLLVVLVGSAAIGLAAALAHTWLRERAKPPSSGRIAVAVGAALAGLGALGSLLAGGPPTWPDIGGAVSLAPPLAGALQGTSRYLLVTTGLLLLSGLATRSRGRSRYGVAVCVVALAAGLFLVPGPLHASPLTWVFAALLGGAIIFGLAHLGARAPASIPGIVATVICAELLVELFVGPYPGARLGSVVGIAVLATLAAAWMREINDMSLQGSGRAAG